MTLAAWLSLVFVCVLGAISPGPSLAVVLRHSISGGFSHGAVSAIAHGLGVGLYAVITVLGLGALLQASPVMYQFLVYGGAAYLAYMGIRALTSKGSHFEVQAQKDVKTYFEAARDGFAIAFLNPKLAIFFVSLFSQFITPENQNLQNGAILVATVLAIDTLWYCIVAFIVQQTKERFALADKGALIDKIAGVVFIGLAARVVLA